jgi:ribonuclease D
MTADRPRKWILGDEILLEAARRMPSTMDQLREIRGLESRAIDAWGPTLLERIAAARTEPRETWPTLPPSRRLNMQQEALVDAMMAVIRLRGSQHKVSALALASRKQVERLILDGADVPLLHGWRAAIAGDEVQNLLRGKLGLEVHEGTLRTVAIS